MGIQSNAVTLVRLTSETKQSDFFLGGGREGGRGEVYLLPGIFHFHFHVFSTFSLTRSHNMKASKSTLCTFSARESSWWGIIEMQSLVSVCLFLLICYSCTQEASGFGSVVSELAAKNLKQVGDCSLKDYKGKKDLDDCPSEEVLKPGITCTIACVGDLNGGYHMEGTLECPSDRSGILRDSCIDDAATNLDAAAFGEEAPSANDPNIAPGKCNRKTVNPSFWERAKRKVGLGRDDAVCDEPANCESDESAPCQGVCSCHGHGVDGDDRRCQCLKDAHLAVKGTLEDTDFLYGRLAEASYNSVEEAAASSPEGYTLDRLLSDRICKVFVNERANEVVVSFKGTLGKANSIMDHVKDLKADFYVATNNHDGNPHYQAALEDMKNIKAKYPPGTYKIMAVGHSLGGSTALYVCNAHPDIKCTIFNPGSDGLADSDFFGKDQRVGSNVRLVMTEMDNVSNGHRSQADVIIQSPGGGALTSHSHYPGSNSSLNPRRHRPGSLIELKGQSRVHFFRKPGRVEQEGENPNPYWGHTFRFSEDKYRENIEKMRKVSKVAPEIVWVYEHEFNFISGCAPKLCKVV